MGLFRRNKVWWMTFIHQGQQVRRSTGTTDKRLAEAILGKVRVKIVEGRFFDTLEAKDHTFNDMMDRYAYSDEVGHRFRANPATPRSPATQGLSARSSVADFRPIWLTVCASILLSA